MIFFSKCLEILKAICLVIILLAFSKISYAQDDHKRTGWWGDIEAGIGWVELSAQDYEETDPHFYLGFTAGYSINPTFLIGIELSGWLLEASNNQDPEKGEGLSQVFLITRYYPIKKSDLFAKAGYGYVSHWNNELGATGRREGWGLVLGMGYDFAVGKGASITPLLTYSYGDLKNQKHNAISLVVGLTLH